MDTRHRTLELKGCWPGDRPVSWQTGLLDRGNRITLEFRKISRNSSSEFFYASLSKARPSQKKMSPTSSWLAKLSSRIQWLPGSHEDSEERLFVFRIFETSSRALRVGSKPLTFEFQHVRHFEGVGALPALRAFSMRNAFNNMNESRGQNVRAQFVSAGTNSRPL